LRRAAASRSAATNRRTWLIAANVSQAARLSSRCVRSAACWAIVHPVPPRQLAEQRRYVLSCLQPRLCPDEARLQQLRQPGSFPAAHPGPYPGSSSRLRFCCPHKHMIARRLPSYSPIPYAVPLGQNPNGGCRTSTAATRACSLTEEMMRL
jgi:hypothetical protein